MSVAWPPDRRAEALVPQRADLIRRLPFVVPAAHFVSDDERELIVDEALGYVVMEYRSAISSAHEAEEVFWTAARLRVSRVLEGRNATVRGRFERTSHEELDRVAVTTNDPADLVEQTLELDYVAEFAASLDELEGQVLRVKWLTEDDALGYRKVAERLAITPARARAAERAIAGKRDRFATLCAGGRLCAERSSEITALAIGTDGATHAVRAAKAHIKHCSVCKTDYVAQLRAVRSAAFQRKVASVIPAAPLAESGRRHGGPIRDLIADWFGRLGGHDAVPTVAHTAASGVGRGSAGVLAVKIAAVLAGGAATIGAATGMFDAPSGQARPDRRPPAAQTATPTATPTRTATPKPTAAPAADRQQKRRSARKKTQGGTRPSSQEQAPASSAPAGSQPNGSSEFSPNGARLGRPAPAPVPAAPGASEFP